MENQALNNALERWKRLANNATSAEPIALMLANQNRASDDNYSDAAHCKQAQLTFNYEMIRNPETLEPAVTETSAICDRMLELGVIIQPTGDHMNILKTKPPLCIDVDGADFYVDALDRVLTEGW